MLSRANLVRGRLKEMKGSAGIWEAMYQSLFKRNKTNLYVITDDISLLRAEDFLDDLVKLSEGEYRNITIEHLIMILYYDFLLQLREGHEMGPAQIAEQLMQKRRLYFSKKRMDDMEEAIGVRRQRYQYKITLPNAAVRRGEIFILDAMQEKPGIRLMLEDVLSVLFYDFVSELRKGNNRKIMGAILDRLEEEWN